MIQKQLIFVNTFQLPSYSSEDHEGPSQISERCLEQEKKKFMKKEREGGGRRGGERLPFNCQ